MHDITTYVVLITFLVLTSIAISGMVILYKNKIPAHRKKYVKAYVIVFLAMSFLLITGAFKLGGDQKEYFPTVQSFDSERSTNTSYNKSIDQRYQNKNHEKADNRLNQLIKDLDENN